MFKAAFKTLMEQSSDVDMNTINSQGRLSTNLNALFKALEAASKDELITILQSINTRISDQDSDYLVQNAIKNSAGMLLSFLNDEDPQCPLKTLQQAFLATTICYLRGETPGLNNEMLTDGTVYQKFKDNQLQTTEHNDAEAKAPSIIADLLTKLLDLHYHHNTTESKQDESLLYTLLKSINIMPSSLKKAFYHDEDKPLYDRLLFMAMACLSNADLDKATIAFRDLKKIENPLVMLLEYFSCCLSKQYLSFFTENNQDMIFTQKDAINRLTNVGLNIMKQTPENPEPELGENNAHLQNLKDSLNKLFLTIIKGLLLTMISVLLISVIMISVIIFLTTNISALAFGLSVGGLVIFSCGAEYLCARHIQKRIAKQINGIITDTVSPPVTKVPESTA